MRKVTKNNKRKTILITGLFICILVLSGFAILNRGVATNKNKNTNSSKEEVAQIESKNGDSLNENETLIVNDDPPTNKPAVTNHSAVTIQETEPTQSHTKPVDTQQPTQTTQIPTCNETMKTSYTNLYNSKVAAENARWANQINGFNNYASAHGMSFSGYVQDQINQYKPAHDSNLASIESQYAANLASVYCN